jgi:hypothetical protein
VITAVRALVLAVGVLALLLFGLGSAVRRLLSGVLS